MSTENAIQVVGGSRTSLEPLTPHAILLMERLRQEETW